MHPAAGWSFRHRRTVLTGWPPPYPPAQAGQMNASRTLAFRLGVSRSPTSSRSTSADLAAVSYSIRHRGPGSTGGKTNGYSSHLRECRAVSHRPAGDLSAWVDSLTGKPLGRQDGGHGAATRRSARRTELAAGHRGNGDGGDAHRAAGRQPRATGAAGAGPCEPWLLDDATVDRVKACEEDRYRILSQSVRSGWSPVVGDWPTQCQA